MATHISDEELHGASFRLAHSMLTMLDRAGIGPDVIGLPDAMDVDALRRSFDVDAEMYMSMDPVKLTEEYDEIRDAAAMCGTLADPNGVVEAAKINLAANWAGEAAEKFFTQLHRVQERMETQLEYTLVAAEAVGMMYAVNVNFRTSCHDLMHRTADVCDVVAEKLKPPPTNWAKIGIDIVGVIINVIKSPTDIANMAINQLLGAAGKATEPTPVPGDEAGPVVDGYVDARNRLFEAYESSMDRIHDWVRSRDKEYVGQDDMLPEPLPVYTDVDGQDFTYEKFFYEGHDPADYGAEVERERQRYVEEKHGLISQRLEGSR